MADRATLRHEPDQPRLTALMLGALAVVVMVAGAMGVGMLLSTRPATEPPRPASAIAGEARLQPAPAQDIATYRADKERLLHDYAWVDRPHGVVRIPIERAMALLAQSRAAKAAP